MSAPSNTTSVSVCVFSPFILDVKFVGCTSWGHTGFIIHLPSAIYAFIFLLFINYSVNFVHGIIIFLPSRNPSMHASDSRTFRRTIFVFPRISSSNKDGLKCLDMWMRRVIFYFLFIFIYFFLRTSSARGGGGGGDALPDFFFFFFFFPCSADHERDWPPCKVVFFGLATNALNVRNNNNNNIFSP